MPVHRWDKNLSLICGHRHPTSDTYLSAPHKLQMWSKNKLQALIWENFRASPGLGSEPGTDPILHSSPGCSPERHCFQARDWARAGFHGQTTLVLDLSRISSLQPPCAKHCFFMMQRFLWPQCCKSQCQLCVRAPDDRVNLLVYIRVNAGFFVSLQVTGILTCND